MLEDYGVAVLGPLLVGKFLVVSFDCYFDWKSFISAFYQYHFCLWYWRESGDDNDAPGSWLVIKLSKSFEDFPALIATSLYLAALRAISISKYM